MHTSPVPSFTRFYQATFISPYDSSPVWPRVRETHNLAKRDGEHRLGIRSSVAHLSVADSLSLYGVDALDSEGSAPKDVQTDRTTRNVNSDPCHPICLYISPAERWLSSSSKLCSEWQSPTGEEARELRNARPFPPSFLDGGVGFFHTEARQDQS